MQRRISNVNLATLILLGATACVVCVVGVLLVRPGPAPGFGPPAEATILASPTFTAIVYPTLPPEWTATPSLSATPSATRPPPTDDQGSGGDAGTPGSAQTLLPDLNGTAAAGNDARVKSGVPSLRVRSLPGTAGVIVATLPALGTMRIVGRTPDNLWMQISAADGINGWVMAEFIDIFVNLVGVPVTAGAALEATLTPIPGTDARIKTEGDHLRLRQSPGTAGEVVASLPALMILHLVGRTADNVWLQVITDDHQQGWVMSQFLDIFIDLGRLPVTGTAVNAAPPTATHASPAGGAVPTQIAFVPTATDTEPPPTPTDTPAPTPTDLPPPTPTNPPPHYDHPSDYISGITDHARQIYLTGQSAGNRANVFSKVGDSISVMPQFLNAFGYGQYDLRDYGYLAETVAFFASGWARTNNSFANTSLAAKGAWSSFSVLSPSAADHSVCRTNETPLLCEYRLSRPSVALIMLGTNDVFNGTSSDAYRANMERIVADSLTHGVIPVLCAIPPFHRTGYEARPAELNDILAGLAQTYDIPFWNYWAATQGLPNEGLGSDGIHPATAPNAADFTAENLLYGATVHNLTALQVLDELRREAMY